MCEIGLVVLGVGAGVMNEGEMVCVVPASLIVIHHMARIDMLP